MALSPPETPEGPGWCGQGAARDQHGPDLSGVASQRPNRLRGLSVKGGAWAGIAGSCSAEPWHCSPGSVRARRPSPRKKRSQINADLADCAASQMRRGGSCATSRPPRWADQNTGQRKRWGRVAYCERGMKVKEIPDSTDTMCRRLDCVRRVSTCARRGGRLL